MKFQIRIADRIVEIRSIYKQVHTYCESYIIDDQQDEPDVVIESSYDDLLRILMKMRQTNTNMYHANEDYPDLETIERIMIYEKIADAMLQYDTLLVHGAVVSTDGNGYMITAPSGIGKSTRAKLWVDNIPDSIVINGDKPLIRFTEDIMVYGTPWSGKESWNHNSAVPLKAIFFLERADEGEKDAVIPIDASATMIRLYNQTYQPPDAMTMYRIFSLFKRMNGKVNFYLFRSAPTPEAVRLAYGTAKDE